MYFAFQCWCFPDLERNICPLRYCCNLDFPNENAKKRFGEYKKLMKAIQALAISQNQWNNGNFSVRESNQMVNVFQRQIGVSNTTAKGRERRMNQIKWTTIYREIRGERLRNFERSIRLDMPNEYSDSD